MQNAVVKHQQISWWISCHLEDAINGKKVIFNHLQKNKNSGDGFGVLWLWVTHEGKLFFPVNRGNVGMHTQSLSCPTLCHPIDCNPPGSSVHGISQTRITEWVAISSSKGSSQSGDWTWISCLAGGFLTTEPVLKSTLSLLHGWSTWTFAKLTVLVGLVFSPHLHVEILTSRTSE